MRPITLKSLTWATVAAAVASALWLAAVEAERGVDVRLPALAQPAFMLPHTPARAGPSQPVRPGNAAQRKSEHAASR